MTEVKVSKNGGKCYGCNKNNKMKRSLELDTLSFQELEALHAEIDKKYRDHSWSRGEEFLESGGEDIFRSHIITTLFSMTHIKNIVPLITVCKRWSRWILDVSELDTSSASYYTCRLTTLFSKATSLKIKAKSFPYVERPDRFTKLEVVASNYRRSIPLYKWTSLRELILNSSTQIEGLSAVATTLTKLAYYGMYSTDGPKLLMLSNLTHLRLEGVHMSVDISGKLSKLVNLESDYPGHFSSFTGKGRLKTPKTMCGIQKSNFGVSYDNTEMEKVRKDFDSYYEGSYEIRLNGEWKDGRIIAGEGEFGFKDRGGWRFIWVGSIVEGKPVGIIKESLD